MRIVVASAAIAIAASSAHAQLRPLEPAQWRLFTEQSALSAEIGAARLIDQRASLAGEEGNLWEAGNFSIAWRTGRVVLEASGTAQRFFHETSTFDAPYPDVDPAKNGRRHDSGDYKLSTTVRLTPERWPFDGVVRFGTRLPTTDNTTGLDRDALDFFATVGAGRAISVLSLSAEAGLGIHTTREQRFEQDDLFLYSGRAEYRAGPIVPSIAFLGQVHGTGHSEIRGVEDLGELRIGIRSGRSRWVRLEFVHGYETFSPRYGLILTAGILARDLFSSGR
jgi:hypothetical protein